MPSSSTISSNSFSAQSCHTQGRTSGSTLFCAVSAQQTVTAALHSSEHTSAQFCSGFAQRRQGKNAVDRDFTGRIRRDSRQGSAKPLSESQSSQSPTPYVHPTRRFRHNTEVRPERQYYFRGTLGKASLQAALMHTLPRKWCSPSQIVPMHAMHGTARSWRPLAGKPSAGEALFQHPAESMKRKAFSPPQNGRATHRRSG